MERSSPLASLQPNHPGLFPRRMDYSSDLLRPCQYEQSHFNFRDMSMLRSKSDYFSFNPVRGSSPTASLAADLSQNFHIDQTPRLATPRRNLFNHAAVPSFNGAPGVITPPVPSSSPGPDCHAMDLSPLPHKPPFAANAADVLTPDPTPVEDTVMAPPPLPPTAVDPVDNQPARPSTNHQRRISIGARPSLRRNQSATVADTKSTGPFSGLGAPFTFGPGTVRPPPPPILESFADSPPSERKPAPGTSVSTFAAPPLPKLNFQDNGSPIGPVRRMSSARGGAPRIGLGRRTQSLQYGDPTRPMMRQDKRSCTDGSYQPSVDLHEARALKLPHFKPEEEVDALPRITKETLVDVMGGVHAEQIATATVIDCRFEYEFEGGHIDGALNFNDKEVLANKLFSSDRQQQTSTNPSNEALVFHCEYSNHRAPLMAKFIRQRDRSINQHHYPRLTYPDIYILDGGYSEFFRHHRSRCFPQSYVEMESKEHEDACERGMAKVKRRAKLSRAQTYAFGQSEVPPGPASAPLKSASIPELPALPTTAGPFSNPMPSMPFGVQASCLHIPSASADATMAMDIDMPSRPKLAFESPAGQQSRWPRRNDSY